MERIVNIGYESNHAQIQPERGIPEAEQNQRRSRWA
jgi:hypothetical protein